MNKFVMLKMIVLFALTLVACFCLFTDSEAQSYKANTSDETSVIAVLGQVIDCETAIPLQNVYIKYDFYDYGLGKPVLGVEKYTDEWGQFLWRFDRKQLGKTINYNVKRTGYYSKHGMFILQPGIRLDLCLSGLPEIREGPIVMEGTVKDSSHSFLGGVLLSYALVDSFSQRAIKRTTTNQLGNYRVEFDTTFLGKTLNLSASKSKYVPVTEQFTLNESVRLDLYLVPEREKTVRHLTRMERVVLFTLMIGSFGVFLWAIN